MSAEVFCQLVNGLLRDDSVHALVRPVPEPARPSLLSQVSCHGLGADGAGGRASQDHVAPRCEDGLVGYLQALEGLKETQLGAVGQAGLGTHGSL